jgi:Ca-activated chloride channel family protein
MEKLADKGNGNYSYIDSLSEGRKVLVEQAGATLFTIAKDVKIQVEFNPNRVAGYRLIGYENRILAKEDFNDDKKDAGEIGAGHSVTAFYEVVPAGQPLPDPTSVDPLKYQTTAAEQGVRSEELLTVKLRYKAPDGDKSQLLEMPVGVNAETIFEKASQDFQFAASVAAFGMKLRNSPYGEGISWHDIQKIARRNLGEDAGTYRAEFLTLVEKARQLEESSSRDSEDAR